MEELRLCAIENNLFVVMVNRRGSEVLTNESHTFFGLSMVEDPFGEVIARGPEDEPGMLEATLDLSRIAGARRVLPIFHDRRPELYGPIAWG